MTTRSPTPKPRSAEFSITYQPRRSSKLGDTPQARIGHAASRLSDHDPYAARSIAQANAPTIDPRSTSVYLTTHRTSPHKHHQAPLSAHMRLWRSTHRTPVLCSG